MLAITLLTDVLTVRACVGEAVGIPEPIPAAIAPDSGVALPATASQTPCGLLAAGGAA